MNCCNDFGICRDGPGCPAHRTAEPAACPPCNHDCGEGRACPVRTRNAQIIEKIHSEVLGQLGAQPPACGGHAARGTSTPLPLDAPYQWLDDLFFKVLSRALLVLVAVIAVGCTGYVYQYFWGP